MKFESKFFKILQLTVSIVSAHHFYNQKNAALILNKGFEMLNSFRNFINDVRKKIMQIKLIQKNNLRVWSAYKSHVSNIKESAGIIK